MHNMEYYSIFGGGILKKRKMVKRIFTGLLAVLLAVVLLPVIDRPIVSEASGNKTVACLGTSIMASPRKPTGEDDAWRGSYVWFGRYSETPTRYRVLAPKTNKYGGTTVFLDSDRILYEDKFISMEQRDAYWREELSYKANNWQYCALRSRLNGNQFLNKSNGFTDIEKSVITNSTIGTHSINPVSEVAKDFPSSAKLTGEKIFILDYEDIINPSYGYFLGDGYGDHYPSPNNHIKKYGSFEERYWLRTADCTTQENVATVNSSGCLFRYTICNNYRFGVAPAFNVDLSKVIFSSVVSGKAGALNTEYKLTLQDNNMGIYVPGDGKLKASGSKITVPYAIYGSNAGKATRVSILILDKDYTAGNTNGAKIKAYKKLSVSNFSTSGSGTFTLPSDLSVADWGTKYQVYMLAEDVNAEKRSDYASAPVKLSAPELPKVSYSLKYKTSGVGVSWKKLSGASKYRVYRETASGTWKKLTTTSSLSYTDKNVVYGKKYKYMVRALDAKGNFISQKVSGKSIKYLAPAPKITLNNSQEGIQVKWAKMSGAAKYQIYVRRGGDSWSKLGRVKGTTYMDKGAAYGVTCTYAVVGIDSSGRAMNNKGSGKSLTRQNTFVTFNFDARQEGMGVNWSYYPGADQYKVYKKNSKGSWTLINTVRNGNSIIDKNARPNKTEVYTVVAYRDGTRLTQYGTGKSIKYNVPSTVVKTSSTKSGVRLTWGNVCKASEYVIYRKTKSSSWTKIGKTAGKSYIDKNVKSGTTYYYAVVAFNSSGDKINKIGNGYSIKYHKPVSDFLETDELDILLDDPIELPLELEDPLEEILEDEDEIDSEDEDEQDSEDEEEADSEDEEEQDSEDEEEQDSEDEDEQDSENEDEQDSENEDEQDSENEDEQDSENEDEQDSEDEDELNPEDGEVQNTEEESVIPGETQNTEEEIVNSDESQNTQE